MKRILFSLVLAGSLSACGGSLCDRYASVTESFANKAEPCNDEGVTFDFSDEIAACRASEAELTAEERQQADEFLTCLQGVPTCNPDNQEPFQTAVGECVALIDSGE